MLNLQRTAMFIAVADTGSFTAAAEAMGLTKAVVSFHIRQLEEELGVTLLLRTTRRLTLTEAGKLFHQRSVMLLRDAERLQDDVRANHAGLTGELRITTTPEYGSQVVVPLLAEFSQLHGPSRAACLVLFACRSYRRALRCRYPARHACRFALPRRVDDLLHHPARGNGLAGKPSG